MLSCSPSLLEFAHRQPAGSANSHSRRQTRKIAAFRAGRTPVKAGIYRGCSDPRSKLAPGTTNHLYSVAAITNTAGQVVERYSYNAYGVRTVKNPANVTIAKSVVGNDRGLTGYRLDGETGLYAARARMYSGRLGRFLSKDMYRSGKPLGGYQNGFGLFAAYFCPNGLDPSGFVTQDCQEMHDNFLQKCLNKNTGSGIPPEQCPAAAAKRQRECEEANEASDAPRKKHLSRNLKNQCPSTEPSGGTADSKSRVWTKDNTTGSAIFHCCFSCYRHCNFQCCYDKGRLVTSGGCEGTYDFTAHNPTSDCPGDSDGTGSHIVDDVIPHLYFGSNYLPGTVVY